MFTEQIERTEAMELVNAVKVIRPCNEELEESTRYVKRIQEGMMLKEKHFQRLFPESFLYHKPKYTASGDFYWFSNVNHKTIVAIGDCVGHDIPAALMTILSINLMNQIVVEEKHTDPTLILQRLDHKIHKAFGYTDDMNGANDRDNHTSEVVMSVCAIDQKAKTIMFAGAYGSMYIVHRNKLQELKGDKHHVGGINTGVVKPFTTENVKIDFGDKIYMCTDGYASQFNPQHDKKFSTDTLKELLVKTSSLAFSRQKAELDKHFTAWKQKAEQTDDVLIAGFKA